MERQGDEVHIDVDEARAGATPHVMRYVLVISLLLAIAVLSAIWIIGAVSQEPAQGWPVSAIEHSLGG